MTKATTPEATTPELPSTDIPSPSSAQPLAPLAPLAPRARTALRWVTAALVVATALTFVPLWAPLVLAAWFATMVRPLLTRIAKITRGRHRAAGAIVVTLVMVLLLPLGLAAVSLSRGAVDLGRSLLAAEGARSALVALSGQGARGHDGSAAAAL